MCARHSSFKQEIHQRQNSVCKNHPSNVCAVSFWFQCALWSLVTGKLIAITIPLLMSISFVAAQRYNTRVRNPSRSNQTLLSLLFRNTSTCNFLGMIDIHFPALLHRPKTFLSNFSDRAKLPPNDCNLDTGLHDIFCSSGFTKTHMHMHTNTHLLVF